MELSGVAISIGMVGMIILIINLAAVWQSFTLVSSVNDGEAAKSLVYFQVLSSLLSFSTSVLILVKFVTIGLLEVGASWYVLALLVMFLSATVSVFQVSWMNPVNEATKQPDTSPQPPLLFPKKILACFSVSDYPLLDFHQEVNALDESNFKVLRLEDPTFKEIVDVIDVFRPDLLFMAGHGPEDEEINIGGETVKISQFRTFAKRMSHRYGSKKIKHVIIFANFCNSVPIAPHWFKGDGVIFAGGTASLDNTKAGSFFVSFIDLLSKSIDFVSAFNDSAEMHGQAYYVMLTRGAHD